MQCDLILTCVDVTDDYIALGTNIGLVFLYNRIKQTMERLKTDSTMDVITCVKLHHGLDYQLAMGLSSGYIIIYLLPSKALDKNKTLQKVDIKDVHLVGITYIEWSTNGMKLFSGDKNGRVFVTNVDFYTSEFKSEILLDEDKSDSEIIQINYDHKAVLISTKYRSQVVRTDLEHSKPVQIGVQDRKITGNFGACFIPEMCKPSDAKLYACRPGSRVWLANIGGTVLNTFIFKDVLSDTNPIIPIKTLEKNKNADTRFGRVYMYQDNEILTYNNNTMFIIEPSTSQIIGVQDKIGEIIDLAVNRDEIFVLRKNTELALIRLAYKPEEMKHTVNLPLTHPTPSPKDASPSHTPATASFTKLNESAKGFFQKNVFDKFKHLDFKHGSRNLPEESSVKSLIDGEEGQVVSPDLPPVVQLKTPDLTGLQIFPDREASPSPEKIPSNTSSPTKMPSTIQSPEQVKLQVSTEDRSRPVTPVFINENLSNLDSQISQSSSASSSSQRLVDNDIVFSHKVKKKKKRGKAEKLKERDDDSDEKVSIKSTESMTNLSSLDSEQKTSFSSLVNDGSPTSDKGLNALSRADDILKRSLAILKTDEPSIDTINLEKNKVEKSDPKTNSTPAANATEKRVEKNAEKTEVKLDQFKVNKKDNAIVASEPSKVQESKPSTSKTQHPNENKPEEKAPVLSPSVKDATTRDSTSDYSDDIYSIYKNPYSDSSFSSVSSPQTSILSPETEAYLSQPSASKLEPRRLESVEGKMDLTVNIFDEVSTGANTYSLCVSETHIWFTDKSENIYYSSVLGPKIVWRKAAGTASQVAVSSKGHIVWRLHKNVAFAGTKLTSKRPEGLKWVEAVRDVAYVAVDDFTAWYIKVDGNIMFQKGLSKDRPCFKSIPIPCEYNIKQIACYNGVVWAITNDMKLIYRQGITVDCKEGTSWEFVDCGVDSLLFGHVILEKNNGWAVDVLGGIWFVSEVTKDNPMGNCKWYQVPTNEYFLQESTTLDNLKSLASKLDPQKLSYLISSNRGGLIAVNKSGVWVCPEYKNILHVCRGNIQGFRWSECPPIGMATSTAWKHVCANLLDIEWGLVWAQQPNGDMYTFPPTTRSASMVALSPMMICLTGCKDTVWGLTVEGQVVARCGMGRYCPQGSNWMTLNLSQLGDAHLIHISCNNQYIWAVDASGMVYQRIGSKAPTNQELSPVWLPLDSFSGIVFNHIAVGFNDWMVWATDSKKMVYVRLGITENLPIGKEWRQAPGIHAVKLSISKTGVWALNQQNEIFYRYGITERNVLGDYWKKVPGLCTCISVSPNDELWGVNNNGSLLQCHSKFLQRQEKVDEIVLRTLSVGSDEGEWELV
ncbi:hypothetical protein LOTGIDRAFT_233953 [Lottia gigantea]|uniref:HPS5-like beta-propeller domain-containing protein n=1 Tax=Lottia gigantea TaxID=225164 RepID=V4BMJ4_LOTGI|nr:hypothetical protein LOTGIDRAFT_233953 [Lottia gigantea]ESO90159.1 hypothetical protein LOTGIDRAFT_233953 [Lottia gigantea]